MRSIVLLDHHLEGLRQQLFPESGHEGIAYILCGVAEGAVGEEHHQRYLSHVLVELPSKHVRSSSPSHITADTATLITVLKRAHNERLTVMVVHSHRPGPAQFSTQDDADEPKLIELAQHRNGSDTQLISMILAETGDIAARVWLSTDQFEPVERLLVVGQRIQPVALPCEPDIDDELYARQLLALGPAFQNTFSQLSFGIVGAGATGSATAMLLARMGANHLFVVDNDIVETSNLNRLHGAGPAEAESGRPKVDSLKAYLESFRPGIHVHTHIGLVDDPCCREALRGCDIIFGCTDDHDGRLLLNRLAYFYLIPVIDMGIGIDFESGETPRILDAAARVTTLIPGHPCLLCRGIIDTNIAREEALERQHPDEYARQVEEAYVRGGGNPNPAVVSYTTEVACMAVDELIERLIGYRQVGPIAHRVRKFRLAEDKRPGLNSAQPDCPICQSHTYWGRGDIDPFLDRVGT